MSTVTGQQYAYSDRALEGWARRVRRWARDERDVYVYFDNDVKVGAPFDALSLMRKLRLHWPPRATNGTSLARHSSGAFMLGVSCPVVHSLSFFGASRRSGVTYTRMKLRWARAQ